jgi:dihydrodipicolinate synthase/N-acetylneuraminate lyase
MNSEVRQILRRGVVIPAMPLALTSARRFDERRQRALCRYYSAAGAGGLAVGVHSTQFEIRQPDVGLYEPVLGLVAEEINRLDPARAEPMIRIAGLCGRTEQAAAEAATARALGYHVGMLSLAALAEAGDDELIAHCRAVADIIPLFGFYLQPAVGGRMLPYSFWRRFAEIENVVGIKIAPFNRYFTIDVVRGVADAGRPDIALYTGNDDTIVIDLLTPYRLRVGSDTIEYRIVGGLLGHWGVWTLKAVELLAACHRAVAAGDTIPAELLQRHIEVTDCNAAFFDTAHDFAGCIPGIHEVLRRQGLLEGTWCLNPNESLSPGQATEINRVYAAYPHLNDDAFVREHLDDWLR